MTLKFASLFHQRDVRLTPESDASATATSTSVGLTDGEYVTLANHADMTDERVLTAGEGIDLADGGANSTITISGENASTTNKGIASFNSVDFSVSSGAVSLNNKTSYWSAHGAAFKASDNWAYPNNSGDMDIDTAGSVASVMANLPNGAVITAVSVWITNPSSDEWTMVLGRTDLDASATSDTLGTATGSSTSLTDSTISNATVDNSNYGYYIYLSSLAADVKIIGARITYTTDYD